MTYLIRVRIESLDLCYRSAVLCLAGALAVLLSAVDNAGAVESFDIVSSVVESPDFNGKKPLEKLLLAAQLIKSNKLNQSDLSFILLDWADRYLREPDDPLQRLERWAKLTNEDKLRHVRIPRDFLNRILLAEYLVNNASYLKATAKEKLEILRELGDRNLVDWSVALAYARIYAGGIVMGVEGFKNRTPLQALETLRNITSQNLVGWHYTVPTEAVLAAEALAMDSEYENGEPAERLKKLRALEGKGLISMVNRRELEKLPVWRLLEGDPKFMKAGPAKKREHIDSLKSKELISLATEAELLAIFRVKPKDYHAEPKTVPPTRKMPPVSN